MYLIVGLGNPEGEYSNTRHNMGFDVVNKLAQKYEIDLSRKQYEGIYGIGRIKNEKVILLKPQTYMNESGKSIREYIKYYKIELEKIIVVYDDMDLEKGTIRIRKQGTAGSHNGMKSVVQNIGTKDFNRVRVGIGRPEKAKEIINYVLEKIPKEERKILDEGIEKAAIGVEEILEKGIDKAMNELN